MRGNHLAALAAGMAALLALTGCGQKGNLRLPEGETPPPVAYGESESAGSKELLELPSQAAPERSVELRKRSEEREDDPFDLPPED
ncbi:hypothetical protein GRI91_14270 [Altererythrobacter endophyticus]|uniref:Uncharacterized protein n=2 Tax=Altericroceibacterium endophyticum TaxID=1808508 RepID=A0A6I4T8C2_9SPHN|nr:hypothetical protein [Altericroceibacterium endophyticum]